MLRFVLETFVLGLKNLRLHKLRSLLTALGIILGVLAVIVMVAIGEGAKQAAMEQMEQLGATNILVRSVPPPESTDASQKTQRVLDYGLKRMDFARLKTLPQLDSIVPLRDSEQNVTRAGVRATAKAIGTTPQAFSVMNLELDRGRYFTGVDFDSDAPVCVLGAMAAQQLFPFTDPLGESIMVGTSGRSTVMLRVVGVLAPTGLRPDGSAAGTMIGRNLDQDIYFPLSLEQETFGDSINKPRPGGFDRKNIELSEVWLRVTNVKYVEEIAAIAENTVRLNHQQADFEVKAPIQILRNAEQLNRTFNFVMGGTAAVSLLVGGIGIMNIMLASVTERTKEIGIRRALGAKRRDITLQFLVETTVLSLSGGLIGIAVGVGTSKALPWVVRYVSDANYRTSVASWSVIGSFMVSGLIGIGFGLYPAIMAARMNPIEALRHE
jgi:putative ABC transport system permease protein